MIRSDAAALGLSGPTGAAMEGGGSYNRNSAQQGALASIDPFLFSILTNRGTTSALCFKWCTPIQAAICETSRTYLLLLPASRSVNRFSRQTRSRLAGVPMH